MRKNYDFSKARPKPCVRRLKRQITIRIDEPTIDHFTALDISPRELDVIWLSAQGLDNEAIAQALEIIPLSTSVRFVLCTGLRSLSSGA